MRLRLPWLVALPLMVAGSLAAHALSYPLVAVRAEGGGHELVERSSSGSASQVVLLLGVVAALGVVAGASWVLACVGGHRRRGVPPWLFFVLPPLAFSLQELSERLFRAEAAPFQAALEPRFLLGLALQVPFGLVALLAARLLLRVVERIARALGRPGRVTVGRLRPLLTRFPVACELPRLPALALGHPQRGPPVA